MGAKVPQSAYGAKPSHSHGHDHAHGVSESNWEAVRTDVSPFMSHVWDRPIRSQQYVLMWSQSPY